MHRYHGSWGGPVVTLFSVAVVFLGDLASWLMGLFILLAVLGSAWAAYDFWRSRRMRDEYREFAQTHGWTYLGTTHEFNSRFSSFPFGQGSARRQESVVRGTFNGQQCASFAQVFETARDRDTPISGKHAYQVTLAEIPVALPRLDIVPENLPAAISKALGGGDIDVESHEFNRRWRVMTNDPRYAHSVLDPRMVERLLHTDVEGLAIRIEGGAVYVWSMGRQSSVNLARRLGVVTGIARRIPEHVIREYRELGYLVQRGDAATRAMGGPAWATEPGALTSRRYTGIGVDADGDGIEDWKQMR